MNGAPDDQDEPKPIRRRRAAVYENGASFAEKRQMVIDRQGNLDVIASRLDGHVDACENFRKLLLTSVTAAAALIFGVIGVLYNNQSNSETRIAAALAELGGRIAEVRARQDVVISRLSVTDQAFDSLRREMGDRFSAVVAANSQRENTFGQRFVQIEKELNDLAREFYAHRLRENNSDDYQPSSGPTRRR